MEKPGESVYARSDLLRTTAELAHDFLKDLPGRRVGAAADRDTLHGRLGGDLPEDGADPLEVLTQLARGASPGLVASAGSRYFGFVIGGALPVTVAADWLTSAWDQNAGLFVTSPAASAVEEIAGRWLIDLFGLPFNASIGFVTGGLAANFTALAAARHEVLRRAGWDGEEEGLQGAPPIRVIVGAEAHVTIFSALRLLGLGRGRVTRVEADQQGRIRVEALRDALHRGAGPLIVCAQAGNVNTGAFDPFDDIAALTHDQGGWLHVDGAFGLWAAASAHLRHLVEGVALADSWAVDGHKWLNVPYDCGMAITAHPAAHRAALGASAAYLIETPEERDPFEWTPEFSRRARGFTVYAALRALGRRGLAEMIDRCATLARRMAAALAAGRGVEILNEVVLNQVLVRFTPAQGNDAEVFTRLVIRAVQEEGTCWLGGTTWQGKAAMRISVSNWSTTEEDIDRSAAAILRVAAEAHA